MDALAAGFTADFAGGFEAGLTAGLALGFVAAGFVVAGFVAAGFVVAGFVVAGFVAVFAAGFLVRALSEDAFAAGAFAVDTEDFAGFALTTFAAVPLEFEVFEVILGAEDLPDLPDIALNTPYAEVTFKCKLSSLLKQALF